jgi:hypothetical protein
MKKLIEEARELAPVWISFGLMFLIFIFAIIITIIKGIK